MIEYNIPITLNKNFVGLGVNHHQTSDNLQGSQDHPAEGGAI